MAGSPTVGTTLRSRERDDCVAGADKTVLGLGIGPTSVGLEWGQNGLRFLMKQPIPTFGPIVTTPLAVAGSVRHPARDQCGKACRCKSCRRDSRFCTLR